MDCAEELTEAEYRALAQFRYELRRFLHFSEQAARSAGLEPQQHQLLLAIRGMGSSTEPPTIRSLAEWLQVQHHSAVELVNRAAERGLVVRRPDPEDRRRVHVVLTPWGEAVLHNLSVLHQQELRTAAPALRGALEKLMLAGRSEVRTA